MAELTISGSDVSSAKRGGVGIAGEAVSTGNIVYQSSADQEWNNASASVDRGDVQHGIIVSGGVDAGQQIVVLAVQGEVVSLGSVLTAGKLYVMASAAGKIAEQSDLQGPQDEVQTVSVSGASSGTFTLTFDGETTSAIAYNASAAAVETALEALSNIDAVSVSGGPLNSSGVAVTFEGENAATDVSLMTVTDSTDGTVSVVETTAGYSGDFLFIVGHAKSSTELELILKYTGDLVA